MAAAFRFAGPPRGQAVAAPCAAVVPATIMESNAAARERLLGLNTISAPRRFFQSVSPLIRHPALTWRGARWGCAAPQSSPIPGGCPRGVAWRGHGTPRGWLSVCPRCGRADRACTLRAVSATPQRAAAVVCGVVVVFSAGMVVAGRGPLCCSLSSRFPAIFYIFSGSVRRRRRGESRRRRRLCK